MVVAASQRIYMGRCPKVSGYQVSRLEVPSIDRLTANDKDFSAMLSMTIRDDLIFLSH